MEDADDMLRWKNYEETMRYSISTFEKIKKPDHYKWLKKNIKTFRVILNAKGRSIGALRIDGKEVSIWIDRRYRGRGIATYILSKHTKKGMIAKIVLNNFASMKAFIRAGFMPEELVSPKTQFWFYRRNSHFIFKK